MLIVSTAVKRRNKMRKNWPDGVKMGVALTFDLDAETFWFSRTMESMYNPNLMAEGNRTPY